MKVKEIKDLIDFLTNSGLEEVKIETEEFKINVKRSNDAQIIEKTYAAPVAAPAPIAAAPAPVVANTPPASAPEQAPPKSNLIEIKSPMIGTFYGSPNPESPAFKNVGDKVSIGDPVCIIEAMKLFNEIESEVSGTIVEMLVGDAQPVEYDQPLFLVDPS